MLNPIQITEHGELLEPWVSLPEKDKEASKLSIRGAFAGTHRYCRTGMHIINVSEKHDVLVCSSCCLRIHITKGLQTWAALEDHFRLQPWFRVHRQEAHMSATTQKEESAEGTQ